MEQNYYFDELAVRIIVDNQEQVWFSGVDICKALDYAMPSNIIKNNLEDDERKLTNITDGSGQKRKAWIINESGLYSLILTSTKSEAKVFKRWITHEVLPQIRKAGKYTTDEEKNDEAILQQLAGNIEELRAKKEIRQKEVTDLRKEIDTVTLEMVDFIKRDRRQLRMNFKNTDD